MRKTYSDLYNDYEKRYNGKPKHNFSHFIRVVSQYDFHRIMIRPKIKWWYDINKM